MSSCECPNRRQDKSLTEEKGAAKVHKLELRAYHSAMRALYASGHITWEQETLADATIVNSAKKYCCACGH